MKITVQYFAQSRVTAGCSTEEFEFASPPLVRDVLRKIVERHDSLRSILWSSSGEPQPSLLVFVNDSQVRADAPQPIPGDCTFTLLPPIGGG